MKFRKNRLYLSLQYRKKLLYVFLSLILSLGLLCTGVLDLVFLALEKPDITTHSALTTVMVSPTYALNFAWVEIQLYLINKIKIYDFWYLSNQMHFLYLTGRYCTQ